MCNENPIYLELVELMPRMSPDQLLAIAGGDVIEIQYIATTLGQVYLKGSDSLNSISRSFLLNFDIVNQPLKVTTCQSTGWQWFSIVGTKHGWIALILNRHKELRPKIKVMAYVD